MPSDMHVGLPLKLWVSEGRIWHGMLTYGLASRIKSSQNKVLCQIMSKVYVSGGHKVIA